MLPQIYNHVAAGFNDSNPYLRELTLKSLAVLGPKLSQKTLSQSLLKHLAKLQVGVAATGSGGRLVALCMWGRAMGEVLLASPGLMALSTGLSQLRMVCIHRLSCVMHCTIGS